MTAPGEGTAGEVERTSGRDYDRDGALTTALVCAVEEIGAPVSIDGLTGMAVPTANGVLVFFAGMDLTPRCFVMRDGVLDAHMANPRAEIARLKQIVREERVLVDTVNAHRLDENRVYSLHFTELDKEHTARLAAEGALGNMQTERDDQFLRAEQFESACDAAESALAALRERVERQRILMQRAETVVRCAAMDAMTDGYTMKSVECRTLADELARALLPPTPAAP